MEGSGFTGSPHAISVGSTAFRPGFADPLHQGSQIVVETAEQKQCLAAQAAGQVGSGEQERLQLGHLLRDACQAF
jgi:hypothetical protein